MERRHRRFFKAQLFLSGIIVAGLVYFAVVGGLVPQEEEIIDEAVDAPALTTKAALNLRSIESPMPSSEQSSRALGPLEIQNFLSRLAEEKAGTWHLHNVDWVADLGRPDQFALFQYLSDLPVNEWRSRLDALKNQSRSSLRATLGVNAEKDEQERAIRDRVV